MYHGKSDIKKAGATTKHETAKTKMVVILIIPIKTVFPVPPWYIRIRCGGSIPRSVSIESVYMFPRLSHLFLMSVTREVLRSYEEVGAEKFSEDLSALRNRKFY